jgi:hypothetical protein
VPGPPAPLFVAGARIHSAFGMAPILDGLGLILVVLSYNGRISIGVNSCEQIVPDPDNMAECIEQAFEALELAVAEAGPIQHYTGQPVLEETPHKRAEALQAFHEASRALDEAIDALGNSKNGKKNKNKYRNG